MTAFYYKDESDQIFHTYSTYSRGGEEFLGIYQIFRRYAERAERDWAVSLADRLGSTQKHVRQGWNQSKLTADITHRPVRARFTSKCLRFFEMNKIRQGQDC